MVELRRQRMQFEEIGALVGISKQAAWKLYQTALAEIPAASVAAHRAEELVLVDDAISSLLGIIQDRDVSPRTRVEAWNSARGWAEHKARLVGLNAPVKVEVSDAVDAELQRLAARLGVLEPGGEAEAPGDAEAGREQAGTT